MIWEERCSMVDGGGGVTLLTPCAVEGVPGNDGCVLSVIDVCRDRRLGRT